MRAASSLSVHGARRGGRPPPSAGAIHSDRRRPPRLQRRRRARHRSQNAESAQSWAKLIKAVIGCPSECQKQRDFTPWGCSPPKPPPDLDALVARIDHLVRAHRAVPATDLRPLKRHLPALIPRLAARGYEHRPHHSPPPRGPAPSASSPAPIRASSQERPRAPRRRRLGARGERSGRDARPAGDSPRRPPRRPGRCPRRRTPPIR